MQDNTASTAGYFNTQSYIFKDIVNGGIEALRVFCGLPLVKGTNRFRFETCFELEQYAKRNNLDLELVSENASTELVTVYKLSDLLVPGVYVYFMISIPHHGLIHFNVEYHEDCAPCVDSLGQSNVGFIVDKNILKCDVVNYGSWVKNLERYPDEHFGPYKIDVCDENFAEKYDDLEANLEKYLFSLAIVRAIVAVDYSVRRTFSGLSGEQLGRFQEVLVALVAVVTRPKNQKQMTDFGNFDIVQHLATRDKFSVHLIPPSGYSPRWIEFTYDSDFGYKVDIK